MTDDNTEHKESNEIPNNTQEIEFLKKKLNEYQEHLEDLVRERTLELEEANNQLQKEIAAHKATEKNLLNLNIEFNQICNVSIPICVIDQEYNLIHVNYTFCSYFEIPGEDVYQMKCYETHRGPRCHTKDCTLQRVATIKTSFVYEHFFITSQNEKKYYILAAHPYISPEGEFLGIIENYMDITARKRTEAALKESETMFRGIFEQSPIAIEIYNSDGELIDANPECLSLFGVDTIDEVKGFKLFEDPNLPDDAKTKLFSGESIIYESMFDFEIVKKLNLYKTSHSGVSYLNVHITPLKTMEDTITGYLVQVMDITERKERAAY